MMMRKHYDYWSYFVFTANRLIVTSNYKDHSKKGIKRSDYDILQRQLLHLNNKT